MGLVSNISHAGPVAHRLIVSICVSGDDLLGIKDQQILGDHIERMSVSEREIDIAAVFILNRAQINVRDSSQHANPGIAFIWMDEKIRRVKLNGQVSELQAAQSQSESQHRPSAKSTDSEVFYQTALNRKLDQVLSEDTLSMTQQTLLSESMAADRSAAPTMNSSRKFNLKQFIHNAVYPAEISQQSSRSSGAIMNASHLIDHLNATMTTQRKSPFLDDTIVDEELILSLSQAAQSQPSLNQSFNETFSQTGEGDILEIMRQLEEQEANQVNAIDCDSVLAPMSQQKETFGLSQQQQEQLEMSIRLSNEDDGGVENEHEKTLLEKTFAEEHFLDSDDDLLNDFSMCLENYGDEA